MYRKALPALQTLILALCLCAPAFPAEKVPELWLNKPAPDFTLADANGKKVSLGNFKNTNIVLVAFWYHAKQESVTELQKLKKILADNKLSNVKVLAVTLGKEVKDRDAAVKKFAEAGLDFTLLFEPRDDISATFIRYQAWWLPAIYVVNKDGRLESPMITTLSEKIGGKTFVEFLKDISRGKEVNGCMFAPPRRAEDNDYKKQYAMIGKPAPDFLAVDSAGQKQSPAYYRGFKNVVLVFWSPGCPHCRRELPQLNVYAKKIAGRQNTQILAVTLGKGEEVKKASKDFFKQFDIKFPMVFDESQKIDPLYNVSSVPNVYVIDKKGIVREVYIGEISLPADVISCAVGKLK